MKMSLLTILEILEQVQLDRDEFIDEVGHTAYTDEVITMLKPVDALVSWISRSLYEELNDIESSPSE